MSKCKYLKIVLLGAMLGSSAWCETDSRMAAIAAQQEEKAAQAKPDEQNKVERGLLWIRDRALLEKFSEGRSGFRAKVGGLGAGTGFGLGPEFHHSHMLHGELDFRAGAQSTFRGDHR